MKSSSLDLCQHTGSARGGCAIFQIISYVVHGQSRKILLHVSIPQLVHEACKYKSLMMSVNHLDLCVCYRSLQWQRHLLTSRTAEKSVQSIPLRSKLKSHCSIWWHFGKNSYLKLCSRMQNHILHGLYQQISLHQHTSLQWMIVKPSVSLNEGSRFCLATTIT